MTDAPPPGCAQFAGADRMVKLCGWNNSEKRRRGVCRGADLKLTLTRTLFGIPPPSPTPGMASGGIAGAGGESTTSERREAIAGSPKPRMHVIDLVDNCGKHKVSFYGRGRLVSSLQQQITARLFVGGGFRIVAGVSHPNAPSSTSLCTRALLNERLTRMSLHIYYSARRRRTIR